MGRKSSLDAASSPSKSSGKSIGNEDGWTDEKTKELMNKMKQLIAKPDVSKYKTSLQRFEWKNVKIDQFSGDECMNQFLRIYKKLRKYKTLSDLVADSLEYLENPYKGNIKKHPDHPKRPLTPYFRFFLSERERYAAKHKDLTNLEITSILSEMYKKISIEEKERLMNEWKEEMVNYRQRLEQFKQDHPEYYDKSPPHLSLTPMQIFNRENAPDTPILRTKKKMSKKDQDILKKKYHDLSDQEKLPYILKAIEEWEKYKEELDMYKKSHPDFVATTGQNKCTLTQSDWRIYDKGLGKPDRPPANGYNLFCTRMMVSDAMKHISSRDRIIKCGQKWKLLTDAEKQVYQVEFLSLRSNFRTEMNSFMKSLTPRQKQEYLERERGTESKKSSKRRALIQVKEEVVSDGGSSSEEEEQEIEIDDETSSESSSSESSEEEEENTKKSSKSSKSFATISTPSHRPTTPISALFLYQKAHKEKCAAKHPNASKSDITIMLARRFNNLPKEKKAKWIQQEKEQRALHNDMMRRKLLEEEKAKNAPPELKAVTGEQIFQEQNKGVYMKKANGSFEKAQELMRRAWTSMNKERRKKYITVAHEQNARNIVEHQVATAAAKEITTETNAKRVPIERNVSQKEIKSYLALEPKKAPNNALALFKVEQKPRLSHLTSSARNQEMARLWGSMATSSKNQYKKRAKAGMEEYNKKLERWKKSLPPQAHKAYMTQVEKMKKSKASNEKETVTNGTVKKRKPESTKTTGTPKKAKLSKEDSDDSSDESSRDEDSASSSDESDDDSDSSSSDDSSSNSDSTDTDEEKTQNKTPTKKDESSGDSSSSSDDDSDSG